MRCARTGIAEKSSVRVHIKLFNLAPMPQYPRLIPESLRPKVAQACPRHFLTPEIKRRDRSTRGVNGHISSLRRVPGSAIILPDEDTTYLQGNLSHRSGRDGDLYHRSGGGAHPTWHGGHRRNSWVEQSFSDRDG